jgi:uncharacterized protein (TIGR00251 family)
LKVRVAAPAEAGKANRAVIDLMRAWLGATDVEIVGGASRPEKTVRIRDVGASAEEKLKLTADS